VGVALEGIYGEETQEIALSLAHHFRKAGIDEKAITYLYQAGEKAKHRSANEAAIAHFTKGMQLLKKSTHTSERDRQALAFHIAMGVPLVLTRGHADPEVEAAYIEARELCERVGDDPEYFQILHGLRRFYLHRGELEKAHDIGEQLLTLAEHMQDPALLSRAHMMHAETLVHLGKFTQVLETCRQGLSLYNPQQSLPHTYLFGNDTGIGCRIFEAQALWHLGYPDQSRRIAQEALSLARQLSHPFTLVFGLYFTACVFHLCRDIEAVQKYTESLLKISQERGFAMYQAWGMILQGWALAMQSEPEEGIKQIQTGLTAWQSSGAKRMSPHFKLFQIEAYQEAGRIEEGLLSLAEALATVEETGERALEAELYRLKGELLLINERGEAEAEACFRHALQIAREQNARGWELRAAMSLCRLEQRNGQTGEAFETLREVYEWYAEGFDTPDLEEAGKLLSHVT
jgi:predicted ATPase